MSRGKDGKETGSGCYCRCQHTSAAREERYSKVVLLVLLAGFLSFIVITTLVNQATNLRLAELELQLDSVKLFLHDQGYESNLLPTRNSDSAVKHRLKRSQLPSYLLPAELRPIQSITGGHEHHAPVSRTRFRPTTPRFNGRNSALPYATENEPPNHPISSSDLQASPLGDPNHAPDEPTEDQSLPAESMSGPHDVANINQQQLLTASVSLSDGRTEIFQSQPREIETINVNADIPGTEFNVVSESHRNYFNHGKPAASTYTRWGKHTCHGDSMRVYSGYAAGSYALRGFAGISDLLCMPISPSWNVNASGSSLTRNLITAVRFSLDGDRTFPENAEHGIIKCAVCLASRTPAMMMPGSQICPDSWHNEYSGYLMSAPGKVNEYYSASRGYCVDSEPDYYTGHTDKAYPKLTFLQAGHCQNDLMPCTNYPISRKLACSVCTRYSSNHY